MVFMKYSTPLSLLLIDYTHCRCYRLFRTILSCLLFLSLSVVNNTFAELMWNTTTQKIEVHPLQASETLFFDFTNTGDKPITIVELKPNCGCITGKVEKKTYAPGESGAVQVIFNLQGRLGAQLKGLTVITDEASAKRTKLHVNTTIPKTYSPSVQRITSLAKAIPIREGLSVEIIPIRDGFEYDLIITPSSDLSRTIIPITIYPAKPDGLDAVRTYTVYALVK
jgi:hypothetical protein